MNVQIYLIIFYNAMYVYTYDYITSYYIVLIGQ